VQRTLNRISVNTSADSKVRSDVRAMRFEQMRLSVFCAKQYEISAEVVHRLDVADAQCTVGADSELAGRIRRKWESRSHSKLTSHH